LKEGRIYKLEIWKQKKRESKYQKTESLFFEVGGQWVSFIEK
jgi:hypothetical protein